MPQPILFTRPETSLFAVFKQNWLSLTHYITSIRRLLTFKSPQTIYFSSFERILKIKTFTSLSTIEPDCNFDQCGIARLPHLKIDAGFDLNVHHVVQYG